MDHGGLRHWEGRPVEDWRTRWGLPLLQVHDAIASTNDVARDLADDGAPVGTTVMAEAQTSGRGRRGRPWTAAPGTSLLLSMVLRPEHTGAETLLSLRLGLAAARAIERVTSLRAGLKWPNDLFVHGYKVGGILCEGAIEAGRSLFLVAGIGVNVTQRQEHWPHDLRAAAASLEQCAGHHVDRPELAGRLVAEWLHAARLQTGRLDEREIQEFRSRDILRGREILVDDRPAGIGLGIEPDGALRAGDADNPRRIIAGTVRFRDLDPGAHS
jgi:BirA family transcriptional regulator, biotin operon repressor / biotin---[acetyl-CoA-carboxylase] ligase